MNNNLKKFLHRGMLFGGFGPLIVGIVYLILGRTIDSFAVSGEEIFLAVISIYLLAFVHAGASVFNQIEEWSIARSLLCHFATLYAAYTLCYLINGWIPFNWAVVGIFTAIFVIVYFVVWGIVFLSVKAASKRLTSRLG